MHDDASRNMPTQDEGPGETAAGGKTERVPLRDHGTGSAADAHTGTAANAPKGEGGDADSNVSAHSDAGAKAHEKSESGDVEMRNSNDVRGNDDLDTSDGGAEVEITGCAGAGDITVDAKVTDAEEPLPLQPSGFETDTYVSPGSYRAALLAVGVVCQAIDRVFSCHALRKQCAGSAKLAPASLASTNAFCVVRPPGKYCLAAL